MLKFSVQPERLELSVEAEAARVSGSGDLGAKSTGATRLERNLDDCGIIVCGVVVIVGFKTITVSASNTAYVMVQAHSRLPVRVI